VWRGPFAALPKPGIVFGALDLILASDPSALDDDGPFAADDPGGACAPARETDHPARSGTHDLRRKNNGE